MKSKYDIDRKIAYRRFLEIVYSKDRTNRLKYNQHLVTEYLKPENR